MYRVIHMNGPVRCVQVVEAPDADTAEFRAARGFAPRTPLALTVSQIAPTRWTLVSVEAV